MAKLIFPQEIEVWYVLPAIRKKIALAIIKKGVQQKDVAKIMGITPAAVCQYKTDKRANKKDFFDEELNKELKKSVEKIIENNEVLAEEIIRLNNLAKEKGIVCKIYKEKCALNNTSENCAYCQKK